MEGQRINTIKSINTDTGVILTMYRTNKRLGSITNVDIGVPEMSQTGAKNKTQYALYCKEVLINLLENGGIDGFYYEKGKVSGESTKYDVNGFTKKSEDIVVNMMMEGRAFDSMRVTGCSVDVTDRYKDGYIKSALAHLRVSINESQVDTIVSVEIKSGQVCRPRKMKNPVLGEVPITKTTINKLFGCV